MNDLDRLQTLQAEIGGWSDETFGDGSRLKPCLAHFKKEVYELYNDPSTEEFADCLMLLLDGARMYGLSTEELLEYTELKLERNRKREWGSPDRNGAIEHVRDGKPIVYLAGPMLDCNETEISTWRETAKILLETEIRDPGLRPAQDVVYQSKIHDSSDIVEPDKEDIFQSDVILANCWRPSAGTSMEIYMGWELSKLVVSIVPPDKKISAWVDYHSDVVFRKLDTAIDAINDWARRK